MTRLLILSDTQIGATTVDLADQQAVLEQAVAVAIDNDVQAVLHAGDVFEGPLVTPEQLRMFLDATKPLRDEGIPLVVLVGNGRHDSSVRRVHALDVLREIDGFIVSARPDMLIVARTIAVCTLPWVSPARLIAQHPGAVDHDAVNEATSRILVGIAAELRRQANAIQAGTFGPANLPAILACHWAISGSKLPSGMAADEMREPVLPWADLDALGYDLIVAGHIHEPQRLDNPGVGDRTVGIVPGSPQQLNFGEHGEHGVWLVDLEPGTTKAKFVPLQSREFVTVDWDPSLDSSISWEWALAGKSITDNYVRVRYEATEELAARIDHDAIRSIFAGGAYHLKIEPTIIRERRGRAVAMQEQDGPFDSLAAYCESEGVDDGLCDRLVQTLREWS